MDIIEQVRGDLLDEIAHLKLNGATGDYVTKVRWILTEMIQAPCKSSEAFARAGYKDPRQAYTHMSTSYPEVMDLYRRVGDFSAQALGRSQFSSTSLRFRSPEHMAAHQSGLLYDPTREMPERPSLEAFRWDYLGVPTPEHQRPAVAALNDPTNLYVFIFGPTGMGKDTLAGHYVLWECIKRQPVAWLMESQEFSIRRMQRIEPYLISPDIYKFAPKVPGAQTPTRSMIYDWGPFGWKKGMVTADGVEVPEPKWTQTTKYFVSMEPEEADPNLWATGVGGATYGSRIQTAVLSDMWDPSRAVGPAELEKQYNYVKDTLDTRLDDDGRLVVLGTMLPWGDPYERLIDAFTDGAVVIDEDQHLTKYSNGTAVVKIKAITTGDDGKPRSYWPVKFPLYDTRQIIHHDGTVEELNNEELAPSEILALEKRLRNGEFKSMTMRRGLDRRRRQDPIRFRAIMQQESVAAEFGDFKDEVFAAAFDDSRTLGQTDPTETLVLGVDPAKTYGAAWVLWGVSRRAGTITLVDFGFHTGLGFDGIKSKLIVEPVTTYQPQWMAYEVNRHEHILEDSIIMGLLSDYGVKVHKHRTQGSNRGDVSSLAMLMRSRIIRLPAREKTDGQRLAQFFEHFRAFDQMAMMDRKSRPGQKSHNPDDIALAAWIGTTKARDLLEAPQRSTSGIGRAVPRQVAERWENYKADTRKVNREAKTGSMRAGSSVSGDEIARLLATSMFEGR